MQGILRTRHIKNESPLHDERKLDMVIVKKDPKNEINNMHLTEIPIKVMAANASKVARNVKIGGASMKARSRNTSTNVVIAQEAKTLRGINKCYIGQHWHGTR